jgi:hypothetical protein
MTDYFICPHCEAEVPSDALACPECGSDEQTGWSENTVYDGLDLYDEADTPTGPSMTSRPSAKSLLIGLAAGVLLAYSAWRFSWGVWLIPLVFLTVGIAYYATRVFSRKQPNMEERLYQDLLRRARGDGELVERLVEYERQCNPGSDKLRLLQDAIDRWESDRM